MVIVGCILGGLQLSAIWSLFGAANQLLAGIALMAVAAWLGQVGKNNKMFIIPMIFMLAATLTSLVITVINKIKPMIAGAQNAFFWGNWFQLLFASAMAILAIIPTALTDAEGNALSVGQVIDLSGKFSTGNIGGLVFFALLIGSFLFFIYKKHKPSLEEVTRAEIEAEVAAMEGADKEQE